MHHMSRTISFLDHATIQQCCAGDLTPENVLSSAHISTSVPQILCNYVIIKDAWKQIYMKIVLWCQTFNIFVFTTKKMTKGWFTLLWNLCLMHKILGDYKFCSNSINSSDFFSQILERQPHTEDRSCSRMLWPSNSVNREVSTHTLTHTDTYVTHERIWGPIWFLKWNDSFLLDSVGLRLYPLRYSSICKDR